MISELVLFIIQIFSMVFNFHSTTLFIFDLILFAFKWTYVTDLCRGRRGRDHMVVGFYNYLCNQCLSPLMWVRISIRARCTTLCDKVCQWLATGWWFSPVSPVSSTNKTDCHHITEILLKVALSKQANRFM
jgi:hypothetical protein